MNSIIENECSEEVAFLSSELGDVTTLTSWTEPEIDLFLQVAGNLNDIEISLSSKGLQEIKYRCSRSVLNQVFGRRLSEKEFTDVFCRLIDRKIIFRDEEASLNGIYTVFNSIEWDDDHSFVDVFITPRALTRFQKLNQYIPLALKHRKMIKRANPLRLYLLIKPKIYHFEKFKKYKFYSVEALREFFGCQNKYKKTNDFIRKIIIDPIQVLNDSDLDITIEYKKEVEGRKIKGISFFARKNKNYKDYFLPADLEKYRKKINYGDIPDNISKMLKKMKIAEILVSEQLKKHSDDHVNNAIFATYIAFKRGVIDKTPSQYFFGVLKRDVIEYHMHDLKQYEFEDAVNCLKTYCNNNETIISDLIMEVRITYNTVYNFIHTNTLNEFKKVMHDIIQLSSDIDLNLHASRDHIMSCGGIDVYIPELLDLYAASTPSVSVETAILKYDECITAWSDDEELNDNDIAKSQFEFFKYIKGRHSESLNSL